MPTMGRRPTPTAIRKLMGNPGKRPINEKEPVAPKRLPKPPIHLSDEALAEWERVALDLYHAGVLTVFDRGTLAAYCQVYGRWAQAETALKRVADGDELNYGLMVQTQSGNLIQNPLVGVANRSLTNMVRIAAELGMTPAARSRIVATVPDGDDDPAAAYFN